VHITLQQKVQWRLVSLDLLLLDNDGKQG